MLLRLPLLLILFLFWLLVAPVLILLASLGGSRGRFRMVVVLTPLFCRSIGRACGMRVRSEGRPDPGTLLFVGNHVSWLDILSSGAAIGGVFVSRHDVKSWPLLGIFARLAGTVFLDRASLRSAVASSNAMIERVEQGIPVVFFPEGGAHDGSELRPFKAFLFGGIVDAGAAVQPFTIDYRQIGTDPVTPENRDLVYWYRPDQNFLSHAGRILSLPKIDCVVRFHEPVRPPEESGKEGARIFAEQLHAKVAEGVPVWEQPQAPRDD